VNGSDERSDVDTSDPARLAATELRPSEASFDGRFASALEDARPLVVGRETRIAMAEPFVLVCDASGEVLDLAVRRITLFAFALSAIVGGLVVARAAPKPVAALAAAWFVPASIARLLARRRRRQLGRTLVDFETSEVLHAPVGGGLRVTSLVGAVVALHPSLDGEAPIWLVLQPKSGAHIRLGRGTTDDIDRCLYVFRKYRIDIDRTEID
jgi:hypothetical protein